MVGILVATIVISREFKQANDTFYRKRGLLVGIYPSPQSKSDIFVQLHLTAEHLPPGMRKAENLPWVKDSSSPVFTFTCASFFRRDEISGHYSEFHNTIHQGLDSYLILRCPMAQAGCSFRFQRLQPKNGRLCFNDYLDGFSVLSNTVCPDNASGVYFDLDQLPLTVLLIIFEHLNSGSLRCLAGTTRRLRRVIQRCMISRSMVEMCWTRVPETASWQCSHYTRSFSKCHAAVSDWCFEPSVSVSAHLAVCPFNERRIWTEDRVPIFCAFTAQLLKNLSLVHDES